MTEILRFLATYQTWVYAVLGAGGLLFIIRFLRVWDELRRSAFGLEREMAQARLNQAASVLVLLLRGTIAEFSLVTFVVPAVPEDMPLPTPTVDLLATPTVTLAPGETPPPTATPAPQGNIPPTEACVPGSIAISDPPQDGSVAGIATIRGSADIPAFGFYKLEYAPSDKDAWQAILAGDTPVVEGELGQWNTTPLVPGLYRLRLVVTDNRGQAQPPCVIRINVLAPTPVP